MWFLFETLALIDIAMPNRKEHQNATSLQKLNDCRISSKSNWYLSIQLLFSRLLYQRRRRERQRDDFNGFSSVRRCNILRVVISSDEMGFGELDRQVST